MITMPGMSVHDGRNAHGASHPFYRRLNQLLHEQEFDESVEGQCAEFYAESVGCPRLPPVATAARTHSSVWPGG